MEWGPVITVLATVFIAFVVETGSRWLIGRKWRKELVAYRLRLPGDLDIDDVARALSILAGSTRRRPIVFEISASSRGIGNYVLVPAILAPRIITTLTTVMRGVRVEEDSGYLTGRPAVRLAREWRCSRAWRPLAADRGVSAIAGVLSVLYPLGAGEVVRIQWTVRATRHVTLRGEPPAQMVRDFAQKQSAPLLEACGRAAVSADHKPRAALLMAGICAGLDVLGGPGVALVRRFAPSALVAGRIYPRSLPLMGWPCLLNTQEAAALVGFPVDGMTIPGLATGSARQCPVPADMHSSGLIVAESNYPGMRGRHLILASDDRLRHMTVQAPTGAGKSELLANMALQDIDAGHGAVVIDPKSDLIADILARIPEHRHGDVILINPSSVEWPVGFNLLNGGHDELSRELVVDRTVHIFSQIWRSSWGPRTADVMRNALLTLTFSRAPDGSAFTLAELPEILLNDDFRTAVTGKAKESIPPAVVQFWAEYEAMSRAERAQVIGPTLNKVRAFLTRTPLRLMLGQSEGLDLGAVFRESKILLVPLSKGVIGPDAAQLLGSLLFTALWQETLYRASIPRERRKPVFAYLDEFQEFIRFGTGSELADMLAQARGLGLGLTLAFQYLDQLSSEVASAVLGTVRSQLVFQLEYSDANTMARRFTPMDRNDLAGLDAFEIALRPCINAQTHTPVTGTTFLMRDPEFDPEMVANLSLSRYGTPREEIDAARQRRIETPAKKLEEGQEDGSRTDNQPKRSEYGERTDGKGETA